VPDKLQTDGFALVERVLGAAQIEPLRRLAGQGTSLSRSGSAYGGRNLLSLPEVRNLAANRALRDVIEPVIGTAAIPVRALFFDKTPEANWPVLWHQDLTIAVAGHEGWGPWSVKAEWTSGGVLIGRQSQKRGVRAPPEGSCSAMQPMPLAARLAQLDARWHGGVVARRAGRLSKRSWARRTKSRLHQRGECTRTPHKQSQAVMRNHMLVS
jgi:hypothetical protein